MFSIVQKKYPSLQCTYFVDSLNPLQPPLYFSVFLKITHYTWVSMCLNARTNRVLIFLFFPCQSEEFGGEGGEFVASDSKEVEVLKTSRGKDLLALDGYVFYKNSQVRWRGFTPLRWSDVE